MRTFDEMYLNSPAEGAAVRDHYRDYAQWLGKQPQDYLRARSAEAEIVFRRVGITFAVYGDKDESGAGTERLIPFDLIPRIIPAHEWAGMQAGLAQRVKALNCFIRDAYHGQDMVRAGLIPTEPGARQQPVPARDGRHPGTQRCLCQYCRHRHRARTR